MYYMEKNNLLMFSPNHKIKIKFMQKKKLYRFSQNTKKWSVIDGKYYVVIDFDKIKNRIEV